MIYELVAKFYPELLKGLKKVNTKINRKRKYKLYEYYFRIFRLLIEIQDCNKDLLYELNLAKRTSYCSHLINVFKTIEIIEVLHRRIFSIIGDDLYHDSIMGLLRTDQYSTYKLLSRFTGEKFQRIYFWKQSLQQFSSIAKSTIENLSPHYLEKNVYNLSITELRIIPLDIDVLSKEYDYVRGLISYEIKRKEVLLDESFIDKQISITRRTIRNLDKVIGAFNTLLKGNIDIYQLMQRNNHKWL